jgi:hypothetical protein
MKIAAATNNKGKLKELSEILGQRGILLVSLAELGIVSEPEETGVTFMENALLKAARHVRHAECQPWRTIRGFAWTLFRESGCCRPASARPRQRLETGICFAQAA